MYIWVYEEEEKNKKTKQKVTDLLRQLGLYFFLESPEQEGAEHFVQTPNDQNGLFLIEVDLQNGSTGMINNSHWGAGTNKQTKK